MRNGGHRITEWLGLWGLEALGGSISGGGGGGQWQPVTKGGKKEGLDPAGKNRPCGQHVALHICGEVAARPGADGTYSARGGSRSDLPSFTPETGPLFLFLNTRAKYEADIKRSNPERPVGSACAAGAPGYVTQPELAGLLSREPCL